MRPFVPMLAQHLGVKDQELLEKDIRRLRAYPATDLELQWSLRGLS